MAKMTPTFSGRARSQQAASPDDMVCVVSCGCGAWWRRHRATLFDGEVPTGRCKCDQIPTVGDPVRLGDVVYKGRLRLRCKRGHVTTSTRVVVGRQCGLGGTAGCIELLAEISEETYERIRHRGVQLRATGVWDDVVDLDRDAFTAEGIATAIGLEQPTMEEVAG